MFVHSGPTDILADPADDQYVDVIELDARHQALGKFQQLRFSGEDIAAGNSLYRVRFIKGILDDGKPERHIHCVQYHARSVRDQMRQRRKSLTVDRGAPVVLAAANGQHLAQTALDRTGKIRMRLDTANGNHIIGCKGRLREMHLDAVRCLTDDLCLHGGVDRNAHGLCGDSVIPKDLFLPL